MPRAFDTTKAGRVNLDLPLITKQQLAALMGDMDQDARTVVIIAVAELWHEHFEDTPPPWQAELDELRAAIARLEQEAMSCRAAELRSA